MPQSDYEDERESLAGHLYMFKRLEQDEPEVAERLGFAGYLQFIDNRFYQNERFNQLTRLVDDVAALKKTMLK